MTTVIINENQNGLLFKNGKYQKTVGAGKYRLFGGRTMEILEQWKWDFACVYRGVVEKGCSDAKWDGKAVAGDISD